LLELLLLLSQLPNCQLATDIQYFQTFPKDTELVVYTNVTHHGDYNGMIRIGVPGELGYRCQYQGSNHSMIQYIFKIGSIKLGEEFYTCADNMDKDMSNCEVHRYTWRKNPEVVDLLLKDRK
jgi:hypothetical protein